MALRPFNLNILLLFLDTCLACTSTRPSAEYWEICVYSSLEFTEQQSTRKSIHSERFTNPAAFGPKSEPRVEINGLALLVAGSSTALFPAERNPEHWVRKGERYHHGVVVYCSKRYTYNLFQSLIAFMFPVTSDSDVK